MMIDQRHIVISGPSGSGKSTLANALLASDPHFMFSVSHTTRPKRGTETHGVDYFFVSKAQFESMLENGQFLEHAIYNGHYYGTSLEQFSTTSRVLILDVERNGVLKLKSDNYDFRYVFVYCSKADILNRLVIRTKYKEKIPLESMLEISNRIEEFDKDYQVYLDNLYDLGIENYDFDKAFSKIKQFLYDGEVNNIEEKSA